MTSEPESDGGLVVGGVVCRSMNGSRVSRKRPLIAVVRRRTPTGRDVWVLPQGAVLDADRTMHDAAVRVVSAEIGCEVSSSRFAGVLDGPLEGQGRVALFWIMEPIDPQALDTDAVDDARVRWVTIDDAAELLAHAGERDVVRFAPDIRTSVDVSRSRRPLFGIRKNNPQLRRLLEEIGDLASELHEAPHAEIDEAADRAAVRQAAGHIRRARQAASVGDVDTGWGQAFRAREALVPRLSEDQVVHTALALRAEVVTSGKIKQWRQDAVASLVTSIIDTEGRSSSVGPPKANRDALREALRIRNESYSNEYRKLTILRRHQKGLLWIGVVALFLVLVSLIGMRFLPQPVDDRWLAFPALAMGVVGAVVSAAQRSTRVPQMRIPQAYNSYVSSLSRVAIGGIAGVLVLLATTAIDGPLNDASVLIGAFGAGFAERLVTEKPASGE
jgi:ADP-ribose pyrophosphatase YjhB (NUDIX family)